jgi:CCR4-NOT transcriptional regulation complex NOT5 subunit
VQLEEVVTVHKKHVQALEKALRCLDNDALTSDELDSLKDDLEYYLVG